MEPEDTLYLQTALQWKALSHPLRLSVIRSLRIKAMTNEELADEIGEASGKLYFHTKMLLDSGLIRLVGTRKKRAITEKLYRAAAMHFQTEPNADREGDPQVESLDSLIELYTNTAREFPGLVTAPESLSDHRLLLLTPGKAKELRTKIEGLVQEAVDSHSAEVDAIPMALTVMFYRLPSTGSNSDAQKKSNP